MKGLIERQVAIDTLDKHLRTTDVPVSYPGIISALTEWLNELPSAQADSKETSSTHKALDTISRQAAIDALQDRYKLYSWDDGGAQKAEIGAIIREIYDLPSAQPETHDERTETHGVCLDTIDRQAALDWLKNEWNGMVTSLFDGIKALPSAQPEIIHCRDCKHWREGDAYSYCQKLFNCGVLDVYDYMRADDDFCSEAERRTNG